MVTNQFEESDEKLLKHSKESLVRIIKHWKERAKSNEEYIEELQDQLEYLNNDLLDKGGAE
jgi:hypothetical protein